MTAGGVAAARRSAWPAPLTDLAAIARRLDAVAAVRRRRRRCARACARALARAPDLARALSRLVARPRRPARPRRASATASRAAATLARAARRAAPTCRANSPSAARRCAAPTAALARRAWPRRSPTNCRCSSATAASCATGYDADARRDARAARRIAQGHRRAAGALRRRDRRPDAARSSTTTCSAISSRCRAARREAAGARRSTRPSSIARRMAGAMRFTTDRARRARSARSPSAADRALELELEIFDGCAAPRRGERRDRSARPREALAVLDVAAALAELAVERDYVRPRDRRRRSPSSIEGGRHPVVEAALQRDGEPFVANDCDLSPPSGDAAGRIWLLTGPNMAGKSTFLRQNALIAMLAQMGSLRAGAERAQIGVVDRLFSRVGAADDLARGRSTFMVEMVETAAILNQAGRALARHPRRDRPRHRDLRRALDRLGGDRASARGQPLPRAVRDAFPRADGARANACRGCTTRPCGSRNGRATSSSCTRSCRAPPTAPTASRWRSSPACRPAWSSAPRSCWRARSRRPRDAAGGFDDLPLFAAARAPAEADPAARQRSTTLLAMLHAGTPRRTLA